MDIVRSLHIPCRLAQLQSCPAVACPLAHQGLPAWASPMHCLIGMQPSIATEAATRLSELLHVMLPDLASHRRSAIAGGHASWREELGKMWTELEQTTQAVTARDRMEVQGALEAALSPLLFPPKV